MSVDPATAGAPAAAAPTAGPDSARSRLDLPRTGIGVDVHPFAGDGRPLRARGPELARRAGLAGHSDGDVAAHAACDALFAAAGLGDLGTHFGTDRPELAGAAGVAPAGRGGPHRDRGRVRDRQRRGAGHRQPAQARARGATRPQAALSAAAGAPVSVAATTTDGLGLTGRGEGVAAIATALVARRV